MTRRVKRSPMLEVLQPLGYNQLCTLCDLKAVATVQVTPKGETLTVQFFHLCKAHKNMLAEFLNDPAFK